jgi:hypothetical protein
MNAIKTIFLASAVALMFAASANSSPIYFDKLSQTKYVLVVLREDGKAEFLERGIRSDNTVYFLHDDNATWGHYPYQADSRKSHIWIKTERYRFDYLLEEDRLTEIDKMGIRNVLLKQDNTSP